MYTNLDTFCNKKPELLMRIAECQPDIIGFTEINPKHAYYEISVQKLMITGYDTYCNLQRRGSVLYVKASLQSLQVKMKTDVDASVWCSVKLHNNDSLLVGSVYRSPNAPDSDNEKFMLMINEVLQTKHSHLLIMGDFNFPEID